MTRLTVLAGVVLLLAASSANAQPNVVGGLKDLFESGETIVTSPDPIKETGNQIENAVTGTANNINLWPKEGADWSEFHFKNNSNLPVLVWTYYYRYLGDVGNTSSLQVVDDSNGWSVGGPWLIKPGEEKFLTATSGRYIYVHAEAELKKGFVASRDWSGKYTFKTGKNSQRNFFKLDLGSSWNEMHFSINETVSVRRAEKPNTTGSNGGGGGKINGERPSETDTTSNGANLSSSNGGGNAASNWVGVGREVRHKIFSDKGVVVEGDHFDDRLQSERQIGQAVTRLINGKIYWVYGNLPPVLWAPNSRESTRVIKWMIRPDGVVMQGSFIDDQLISERAIKGRAQRQQLDDGRTYWVFQDLEPVLAE